MATIKRSEVGKWSVSTVQTYAGGARDEPIGMVPFTPADYADETPWPYETMVFRGGTTGQYHEPHASEAEALERHEAIVELLRDGKLEIGKGVKEPFGNPSTTPEEWAARVAEGV